MGATRKTIDEVVARNYEGWIDDQLAMGRAVSHWDWLVANGYSDSSYKSQETGFNSSVWRQMIMEPDQLRQRVGMALLNMLVVGIGDIDGNWRQFAAAAYVDVLMNNAFGNYRTILDSITTNFAMASFVTFLNNTRASSMTSAQPDENYARELMQLFAIGPYMLNMDGTPVMNGGKPVESYTQDDVAGLARVFTGLVPASSDNTTPERTRMPLVMSAARNETGAASFLGSGTSGGGVAAIKTALDTIFNHPNVPPFVSRQLIQRLVTSNPSPGYVTRVAYAFANNGQGVRGDMKAVIKAILLDSEARSDAALSDPAAGRLREPVLRLTAWARAFNVSSPSEQWGIGDTSSQWNRLGQSMGRSPSIFNFFRPGYTPPATAIARAGMVAPEFQITNEQSVIAYVNFMQVMVGGGINDVKPDYGTMLNMASDGAALVEECNLVLAAGQLSAATAATIRGAVDSVSTASNGPSNRVAIAILLTLASPDFLSVK